jgi:IS5 family transposase
MTRRSSCRSRRTFTRCWGGRPRRRVPRSVTADRSYGEPAIDRELKALGVRTVAIPRKAKISPARRDAEHARGFRKLVKWRTGSEGRISYIKHRYGWDRTRLDGLQGASIWCGHGVFTHNLVKISALTPPCPAPAMTPHRRPNFSSDFFRSK